MDNTQEYMDGLVESIKEKLIEEDYVPIVISGNRILVGIGDIDGEDGKLIPSNLIFELSIRDVTKDIESIL